MKLIIVTIALWFAVGVLTVRALDHLDARYAAEDRI